MVNAARGIVGKWTLVAVSFVLAAVFFGLLSLPSPGASVVAPAHAPVVTISTHPIVRTAAHLAPASTARPAATGFPRTVLVETFTGTWCPHCPIESQALFSIEHTYSKSVVAVSELHITDQYTDTFGIDNARNSYYPVCGYPDVYFDGGHDVCGVYPTVTTPQQEAIYYSAIMNASAIPGNVSISQSATITGGLSGSVGNVSVHADVTSAVTGTFQAWTYLMEYIGVNDSTGHDITDVLRGAVINEPVNLTAGSTTSISGSLPIAPAWNSSRLSVVTFIQDVPTHVIENTNFAPVTSMVTTAAAGALTLGSGTSTTVTVTATNSTTGHPLAGAVVSLASSSGGTLTPSSGLTAGDGTFTSTFLAPNVTQQETIFITAHATLAGYTTEDATVAVTVNPYAAPSAPLALEFAPVAGQVSLGWSAPASGGGGVTYHVYRSTAVGGPYAPIGSGTTPTFVDTAVTAQQIYYYEVDAQNIGGFSPNSTAVAALPVVGSSAGIPAATAWWLVVGSTAFNATGGTSVALHLGAGSYPYQYGVYDYAYVVASSANASGYLTVGASAVVLTAGFAPNYALITGTVYPASAQVLLNNAPLKVSQGAFTQEEVANTYTLTVTSPGYQTNHTTVTLTPGNDTTLAFHLLPVSSGGGSASAAGLTSVDMLALVGVAVVAVVALAVAVMWSRRRGGRSGGGSA